MGNVEVLKRGDIQMTSAGTGISHSEKAHGNKQVHFMQIWSVPSASRLPPTYFTRWVFLSLLYWVLTYTSYFGTYRHFTDEQKQDKWVRVVAPINAPDVSSKRDDSGPAPVHSPLSLYSTILSPSASVPHTFAPGISKGYVHVIQTSGYNPKAASGGSVKVSGGDGVEQVLREGDGAYIFGEGQEIKVENVGDIGAEVLLFDLE